ncbi:MAG: DISARM system helicase DrmA [Geminicoccaceae bacterium]
MSNAMPAIVTSADVRSRLLEALRRDMIGPLPDHPDGSPGADHDLQNERLRDRPSDWYMTGFIAPTGEVDRQAAENRDDPDSAEEQGTMALEGGDGLDDEDADVATPTSEEEQDDPPVARRRYVPGAIGLTVIIPDEVREIGVRVTWADYVTEPPLTELEIEQGTNQARPGIEWVRLPREANVTLPIPEAGRADPIFLSDSHAPLQPGGGLALRAHARSYDMPVPEGRGQRIKVLNVFLVNMRPTAHRRVADVSYAFQCRLELTCEAGFVGRKDITGYGCGDEDRELADLHYRDIAEFAVGRNCAGAWEEPRGERSYRVWSDPLPQAKVERVAPNSEIVGIEFGMAALAEAAVDGATLGGALAGLPEQYGRWIEKQHQLKNGLERYREQTANRLIAGMARARERIASGIERLRSDDKARQAFRLANLAIREASLKRRPQEPAWRPFQLAFILLNLEGLADPHHADRDLVDLLFFPTGGGKTEAYLGLAAFTIAHRRLRNTGKLGAGVSVIMRYTLRLLTLDQLGRAAAMICAMERMRTDPAMIDEQGRRLLGDWPIEIGLWVGDSATPNHLGGPGDKRDGTAHKRIRDFRSGKAGAPAPIKNCPWCNAEFDRNTFHLDLARKRMTLTCRCEFTRDNPLPVVVVDEEIYRRLPAFVVATVDKFAGLPWIGEAGAFFRHVDRHDDNGFYGAASRGQGTPFANANCLEPPDLVIQDELHLISGPLGTVAGLYEAAIDRLASRGQGERRVRPKIVASTATVRRASEQIRALFDRNETCIFPPPGIDRRDSWFARTLLADEADPRVYVGIAAQGRGPTAVFLRSLRTVMAAAWQAFVDAGGTNNKNNPADPYITALCYFNALRELGRARRVVEEEVTQQLGSYGRERQRVMPPGAVFTDRRIGEPMELTSRVSTDEVALAKERLARAFTIEADKPVDIALATNMISVGLDISRLGLMVVQGQPKAAAEYIQATSRVGRESDKPGLVLTLLNLHKPRDRGHYESFTTFHESFYRAVEPTSVTPWAARALDRSLAAVVVALARHLEPELTPEAGVSNLPNWPQLKSEIADYLLSRADESRIPGGRAALRRAVEDCFALWERRIDLHSNLVFGSRRIRGSKYLLFQPLDQTIPADEEVIEAARSMRDVEASVLLKLRNPDGVKFRADDVV